MVFGVHSERLRAIDSFHLDVAVSYGSWVGIIRQMETLITLKFPDGSECKMPDRSVLHLLSHSLNKAFFWERGQFQTLSGLGVVKFFNVPFLQQFSTDLTPKVDDQPKIFPAASICSRTVASNIKNASSLWSSKFYPNKNSF